MKLPLSPASSLEMKRMIWRAYRTSKLLGMIAALAVGMSSQAFSQTAPGASIQVSGTDLNSWNGTLTSGAPDKTVGDPLGDGSSSLTIFTLNLNLDPEIFDNFGATNNTSTIQNYTLTVTLPLTGSDILQPGQYTVVSSIFGTVTNGSGGTSNLEVSPPTGGAIMESSVGTQTAGVDLITAPLVFNSVAAHSSQSLFPNPNGPMSEAPLSLTTTANAISVTTTFTLSPGTSTAFTYDFAVNEVPEPSAYALVMSGVCFLILVARLRRRI